ncbi:MAG: CDP-diacylglycerol--serine O-phosphatidyltransferase [Candidatus Electronema aureum]|uniref:CDP-diacylglycerol--serine O-phosphatidyltransferase n=1 Tax=Candidatus Electronema aureum TaxID=2005002 RepID=A0A521G4B3_9BACT|nr:MAG: CDP-diacylglycerol--serine O-phosphatidyltransferase [Candidatus Electronema aureum]
MELPQPNRSFLLPCTLTIASLFSGFYSMVASINGHFYAAAVAIIVAAIFDGLDGRVARMTGSTSGFGMQLDSLCDMVSFGVAPGLLAYLWALKPYGRYGWLAAFLYVAATALRLARFNTLATAPPPPDKHKSYDFVGLPCPAAAGAVATTVMFFRFLGAQGTVKHIPILLLVYLLSYLMISSHRYLSFKKVHIPRERRFQAVVGIILVMMFLASEPPVTLFVTALCYAASGPLLELYQMARSKKAQEPPPPDAGASA